MPTRILWQKIFVETLFQLDFKQSWYLIIDGLDESDNPGGLISFIGKIRSETPVKVLVTSRHGVELDREFQKLKYLKYPNYLVLYPRE